MPSVTRPLGARVIVDPIITTLDDKVRWERAGLHLITDQQSQPRPTEGIILALGTDPMLREVGLREGLKVSWRPLAGIAKYIEGHEYRVLELQEIIDYTEEVPEGESNLLPVAEKPETLDLSTELEQHRDLVDKVANK